MEEVFKGGSESGLKFKKREKVFKVVVKGIKEGKEIG